jgi:hypothetical protein
MKLVQAFGLERVHEPYIKYLEGRIRKMRLRGRDGIARALYVTATGRRAVILRVFHEEDAEDAAPRDRARTAAGGGGDMSRKVIPVEESIAEWRKDPEYVKACDALKEEFSLAAAMIPVRVGGSELTIMGPQPDDVPDPVVPLGGDNRREVNLLEAIRRRFARFGGVDLELPPREFVEEPPTFDPPS